MLNGDEMKTTREQLAKMIDHTLLRSDTTVEDIRKLCDEAKTYGFYAVCVFPTYIQLAAKYLYGTDIKVCTVVGFPFGANASEVKAFEASSAIRDGVQEIDMVMNIGAFKSSDYDAVKRDIKAVVDAADDKVVKVIIETGLLTDEEKTKACQLVKEAGAHFVKTSTGFYGGATVHDVKLMRRAFGEGVKASGGIRTWKDAIALIKAGATRIGTSTGVAIVQSMETT